MIADYTLFDLNIGNICKVGKLPTYIKRKEEFINMKNINNSNEVNVKKHGNSITIKNSTIKGNVTITNTSVGGKIIINGKEIKS